MGKKGKPDPLILAGDVGGTKVVLALCEDAGDALRPLREARFESDAYAGLEAIVTAFLDSAPGTPRAACFGVAGPIVAGSTHLTNLPWTTSEASLARATGAARVKLLNDLEALAYGSLFLAPEEFRVLHAGERPAQQGNVAVIAAGTGLGEAFLVWDGARHHPVASEGGHADFAPRTEQEIALLRHLRAKIGGRVSYERIVSGPGLVNVYGFLRESGAAPPSAETERRMRSEDPAAVISQAGLAGPEVPREAGADSTNDPLSAAALELFCSVYGAEAGNLALKCVALGGVIVGGGIAPKILPALARGGFVESFLDKGRYRTLLERIPVRVVLNERAPLLGAAHYARALLS